MNKKEQSYKFSQPDKTPVVHLKVELRTEKTETQVSSIIPGNRKAEKPKMFHTAGLLIARDELRCILQNTPSRKAIHKEYLKDSWKVIL